ncbi:hypothetical protein HYW21_05255 [Candidatus Woesearchaeota archaeon]|nr:hypothetical protein [Candidatus Woesearchaeota archaeon]
MKITKKYEYKLSEKTLEKDIDTFIRDTQKGAYQMDHRYGQEGLKQIKAYFRMIEEELKKENIQIARACYKKLMFLLLQSKENYFDYEDIVGKLNFERFISNYFTCLVKICAIEELFREYLEYLNVKEDYYFEAAEKTIIEELSDKDFVQLKELLLVEADKVKKDNYAMHDILTFLLDITKKKDKDEEKFMRLAEKFSPVLGYNNIKEFLEDYKE